MDGTRIDLSFYPIDRLDEVIKDSLTVVLLDKDGALRELPPPSDIDYLPLRPAEKLYQDCCNEFWWVNPYVAKGLWRGALTYSKYMLENVIREQLMKMLTWYFAIKTDFKKSPVKLGKYMNNVLSQNYGRRSKRLIQIRISTTSGNHCLRWDTSFVESPATWHPPVILYIHKVMMKM